MITILLAVIIEIPILLLFKFRDKDIIVVAVFINIATNFLINVLLYQVKHVIDPMGYVKWIFPLEAAVVVIEFIAMSFFTDKKVKLFLVIALANIISYFTGVMIWGFY